MNKIIMILGASSVGKTSVIKWLIPYLKSTDSNPCVCKIDCLHTDDSKIYDQLNIPYVIGLSKDICPDHFLVSNLAELWDWKNSNHCDTLIIETAGLCNRCSPATENTISICVVDCTASIYSAKKQGPMITQADIIALTKIDMVSQAEKEILIWNLQHLNPNAKIFPIDGLVGYGIELLGITLNNFKSIQTYENDVLRHTMPSGVCSYCIGEKRVGSSFQQGLVGKIDFGGAKPCSL